ncbi:Swt1 family HEPN domain-containing protein [Aestuariivivens sediminis]|uniref:Swt1 family HEPN domain-containing protein n=1 Tax=Aestuariivivens sediminis TaxID=2913557 RepID=UPI001F58DDF4|nr:Swt1 family HEPN domain-containing protein [Aestuariivivens sediminis]
MDERIVTILHLPLNSSFYVEKLKKIFEDYSKRVVFKSICERDSIDDVKELIRNSDIVFLEDFHFLSYYGLPMELFLREWVLAGGQLIVKIHLINGGTNGPSLEFRLQDKFLRPFGMQQKGIKLRPLYGYDVKFKKKRSSFLDRKLFEGIEVLSINAPNHIHVEKPAEPLLVNDDKTYITVAIQTDYQVEVEEACPLAIYENSETGCIIGFSGDFIDFEENENNILIINIVDYLLKKRNAYELAYKLYYEIEISLALCIKNLLVEKFNEEWIKMIPEDIISKISSGEGKNDDVMQKMFFIGLKKIIRHNWEDVFKKYFPGQSKSKALNWIGKVNEYRQIIAHPIKSIDERKLDVFSVKDLKEYKNFIDLTFK